MAELEGELPLAAANSQLRLVEPVGYLDMLVLLANARVVLTDSGGMQKEAFFLPVPCITLREGTEWVEPVQAVANRLEGPDKSAILEALSGFQAPPADPASISGDGHAAERIVSLLLA